MNVFLCTNKKCAHEWIANPDQKTSFTCNWCKEKGKIIGDDNGFDWMMEAYASIIKEIEEGK